MAPRVFSPSRPRAVPFHPSDPLTFAVDPPAVSRAQILASASTNEKEVRESLPNRSDKNAAALVGRTIAARAKSADIPAVHFVKPKGKRFHGKMKALIDNMREAGLPLNHSTSAAAAASTSAPAPAAR